MLPTNHPNLIINLFLLSVQGILQDIPISSFKPTVKFSDLLNRHEESQIHLHIKYGPVLPCYEFNKLEYAIAQL